jgi:hypothetical protein
VRRLRLDLAGLHEPATRAATKRFDFMSTTPELAWPRWASWALALVIVTSLLTIGATLNDIL